MRGKARVLRRWQSATGITPAYAGKRRFLRFTQKSVQDHPRLCGEKRQSFRGSPEQPGSPPPMRGKALTRLERFRIAGITPAYAGKRSGLCMRG